MADRTALWFAACNGHEDVVRFLLHQGSDVEAIRATLPIIRWNNEDYRVLRRMLRKAMRTAPERADSPRE